MSVISTLYRAELVKTGFDPLPIRISKAYARTYSGTASEFNLSVAPQPGVILDILERQGGEVFVYQTVIDDDGPQPETEFFSFNLPADGVNYQRGGRNQTITLRGTRQTTNSSPVIVEGMRVIEEGSDFNGSKTWVVPLWPVVRPGDSARIGYQAHLIDRVQINLNQTTKTLTLREAQP